MSTPEVAVLVDDLQEWLESFEGLSLIPVASMNYARDTLAVSIGDVTIWDDQSFYCDERDDSALSLEGCKSAWLAYLESFRPFMESTRI